MKMLKKVILVILLLTTAYTRFCMGQNNNFSFHLIDSLSNKIVSGPIATFIIPEQPDGMILYYYRMTLEKQNDDVNITITRGKEVEQVLPNDSLNFLFVFEDTVYYHRRCSLVSFMDTLSEMKKSYKNIEPISVQINIKNDIILSGLDRSAQVLRYYVLNHVLSKKGTN